MMPSGGPKRVRTADVDVTLFAVRTGGRVCSVRLGVSPGFIRGEEVNC